MAEDDDDEILATSSEGVTISVGNGATPEQFEDIGEAFDFGGLEEMAGTIEVTRFKDRFKKYIADIRDGGSMSLQVYFAAADRQQHVLRGKLRAGLRPNIKIDFHDEGPDGVPTICIVNTVVTQWGPVKIAKGSAKTATIGFKISGEPDYTLGH